MNKWFKLHFTYWIMRRTERDRDRESKMHHKMHTDKSIHCKACERVTQWRKVETLSKLNGKLWRKQFTRSQLSSHSLSPSLSVLRVSFISPCLSHTVLRESGHIEGENLIIYRNCNVIYDHTNALCLPCEWVSSSFTLCSYTEGERPSLHCLCVSVSLVTVASVFIRTTEAMFCAVSLSRTNSVSQWDTLKCICWVRVK